MGEGDDDVLFLREHLESSSLGVYSTFVML